MDSKTPVVEEQPKPDAIAYPLPVAQSLLDWLRACQSLPPGKTVGEAVDIVLNMVNSGKPIKMPEK